MPSLMPLILYIRGVQPVARRTKVDWCQSIFLISRHVRMHRVTFYMSNTLRKLMI